MRRGIGAFLVAVSGLITLATSSAQAVTISVRSVSQTVSVSDSVMVDIAVSGLGTGTAPSVGAYDLGISYDDTLLTFVSGTIGDPAFGDELDVFDLGGNPSGLDGSVVGTVNVFDVSLDRASDLNDFQRSDFVLFRVVFQAAAVGTSVIGVGLNSLADEAGENLTASLEGGRVTVQVVPAPAAGLLLFTGLAGLGWFRRKQLRKL